MGYGSHCGLTGPRLSDPRPLHISHLTSRPSRRRAAPPTAATIQQDDKQRGDHGKSYGWSFYGL